MYYSRLKSVTSAMQKRYTRDLTGQASSAGWATGHTTYRVRLADAPDWSDTLAIEVKHHALSRAIGFFILGALMFLATTFVLLKGARIRSGSLVKH